MRRTAGNAIIHPVARRAANGPHGVRALAVTGTSALVLAMSTAGSALAGPAAAAPAQRLSAGTARPVIIFLKYQPALGPAGAGSARRNGAVAASQAPFLRELAAAHATHVKAYRLVNALSATVSGDEARLLAADSSVARVIPDATVEAPSLMAGGSPTRAAGQSAGQAAQSRVPPGACPPRGGVTLEPEGLSLTATDSAAVRARTARSLGFTGAGVTVGFMADGIDPDNVNFLRADGKSAFTRYADFTGEGTRAATGGGEAFLDASAIAGQGRAVYDIRHFSADSPASPCRIRIEGFAPGASLVGLKVLAQDKATTMSGYLQAIDYAVRTAKVSVLSQSLDTNNYPDTAKDAVKQFDDAAVAAGVTVIASAGDAGPGNTIGSPASDPRVISVGASTDLRYYAQTGTAGARFAAHGWLNDNISALSSAGYKQDGGTVDIVAPGDASFASCDANVARYSDCTNDLGRASDIEVSGGTSQAAPEVAGTAALVIQAYRSAHHGVTPAPALVKRILLSTAADLGAPADEQGAGLLDSYRAVQLALSTGSSARAGETIATSVNQLRYTGAAGTRKTWTVTVTNDGAARQVIRLAGRTYGPAKDIAAGRVTLSDTKSPHFTDESGARNNYGEVRFTVANGADQLTAAIAYPAGMASYPAQLSLIDPRGRYAASSAPQGVSGYARVSVLHPAAGTWTALIFSPVSASQGTTGTVRFGASVSHYASFAAVHPAAIALAPGASSAVSVTAVTPVTAGDAAGALVLNAGHAATTIPVVLRSLIDVSRGGRFSGVLSGGNGRPPGEGQVAYYQFRVPAGRPALSAGMTLANDPAVTVAGYLVAPDGETAGFGSNAYTPQQPAASSSVNGRALNIYAVRPAAGLWTLIIEFTAPVAGDELADRYSGAVHFTTIPVSAPGLPDSPAKKLAPGKAVKFPVTIKNTGRAAEDFFVDPRRSTASTYALADISPLTLPLAASASDEWTVPPQTTVLRVTARATVPVMFDYGPMEADPELAATSAGRTAAGTISASFLTPGSWNAYPAEIARGGFPAGGGKAGTVSMTVTAVTQAFDTTISSAIGDYWLSALDPSVTSQPFVIGPGQTRTIEVTVKPAGKTGTVVRGELYLDDDAQAGVVASGSEVAAIPYAYTIG